MGKSSAKGATLQYKDTTWKTIVNLGDFDFKPFEQSFADVTSHDSPAGTEEQIAVIKKLPKLKVPITLDEAATSHQWLITNMGTTQSFKYTQAGSSTTYAFNANYELTFKNPVKGVKMVEIDFTFTDGSTPS